MARTSQEIRKRVIARLRTLIKSAGGVTAFADSINTPRNTVNNWLRGVSDIRISDLCTIREQYGVSTDYVLGFDEQPTTYLELLPDDDRNAVLREIAIRIFSRCAYEAFPVKDGRAKDG